MTKQLTLLRMKLGVSPWPAALIGMVIIKAVLSLAVKPGSFLVSYSGISYFLLLALATGLAIRNAVRNTLGGRIFWVLLAAAFSLWMVHESLQLYYELGLHIEVPNNSIADSLLFLHVALFMAAVATLPHRNAPDHKPYAPILNALLVAFFWILLYGYAVFPYQYFYSSAAPFTYDLRFDVLYLCGNAALLAMIAFSFPRVKAPWKSVYFNLLGAASLYTLSSIIANLAIDYMGGYVNGKIYGLGLVASVCWFVWAPLRAWQAPHAETSVIPFEGNQSSNASVWAMLVVVIFSIPVVWELLRRNESDGLRTLRVVFAVAMIVCLASAAFAREYLGKRELASHFGFASDRLHLAMQAGSAVAWESDLQRGRGVLFGDLQTIFGIPSEISASESNEVIRYLHPDDLQLAKDALAEAKQKHRLFAREFRIIRPDGAVRWLESRGKFYYAKDGAPERMIGVSLDITQRKQAEEALSGMTRKLIEAQEQERARIGRELHDDVNQRLAVLAIELEQLKENPSEVGIRVQELWKKVTDISNDVQSLSYDLHSSKLEYLGVVAVMKSWCKEFAERHGMQIDCRYDVQSALPREIGLCLFRVLQEAFHNSAKHSGAKRIEVRLWEEPDDIHLIVSDLGKGFDVEATRQGRGLGLTSMQERVRLVNGIIKIQSKPMGGTTIQVRVPSSASKDSAKAASEEAANG